jgi:hypothetical protein
MLTGSLWREADGRQKADAIDAAARIVQQQIPIFEQRVEIRVRTT